MLVLDWTAQVRVDRPGHRHLATVVQVPETVSTRRECTGASYVKDIHPVRRHSLLPIPSSEASFQDVLLGDSTMSTTHVQ